MLFILTFSFFIWSPTVTCEGQAVTRTEVSAPPKLIPHYPWKLHVIEGTDLILVARVEGYPYPWVAWYHSGLLLQNTSNVYSETRILIRNVTLSNGGYYSCYTKNPFGYDSLAIKVYIKGQVTRTELSAGWQDQEDLEVMDINPGDFLGGDGGQAVMRTEVSGREVFTLTALLVIAVIMICLACWENQEDLEVMDNNPEDFLGEDGAGWEDQEDLEVIVINPEDFQGEDGGVEL